MNDLDRPMIRPFANPLFVRCERGIRLIDSIVRAFQDGRLLIPDYQRGSVWTPQQSCAFVSYALSRAPIPAVVVREVDTDEGQRDELIDGQQRLLAMVAWLDGKIPANHYATGEAIWCRSNADAHALRQITIPYLALPVGSTRRDAIETYLALNSGGTPHTTAELDRARRWLRESKYDPR